MGAVSRYGMNRPGFAGGSVAGSALRWPQARRKVVPTMDEATHDRRRHSSVGLARAVGRRAVSVARNQIARVADVIPAPWYRGTHPGLTVGPVSYTHLTLPPK